MSICVRCGKVCVESLYGLCCKCTNDVANVVITQKTLEIKKLRKALKYIEKQHPWRCEGGECGVVQEMSEVASAALKDD